MASNLETVVVDWRVDQLGDLPDANKVAAMVVLSVVLMAALLVDMKVLNSVDRMVG